MMALSWVLDVTGEQCAQGAACASGNCALANGDLEGLSNSASSRVQVAVPWRGNAKETDLAEVRNDANETVFAAQRIYLLYKVLQCKKQIVSTCFGSLQQLSSKLDLHCVSCFTYMMER